MQQELNSSTQF